MRLLMSAASLFPTDFALSFGYLGPPESTPYYPTGDLRGDTSFTTAMYCLEDCPQIGIRFAQPRCPTLLHGSQGRKHCRRIRTPLRG